MFNSVDEFGELDESKLIGLIYVYKEFIEMFNLDNIKTARMLNLPYLTKKNYFRCAICGKLYNECVQQQNHKFKQATYIIKTGILGNEDDIENITQASNKYGHNIKVLIGSKVTGEGLDLKWVRQIHIIDPWHNNTRIYQIIGRGIRNCSHIDLEPAERNVTVYKYSASVPILYNKDNELIINTADKIPNMDAKIQSSYMSGEEISFEFGLTYRQLFTETVDELLYKRIINKDFFIKKIERVLKMSAIDCEFNKNINNYWDLDVDFSRECDYNKCKYKVKGIEMRTQLMKNYFNDMYFRQKSEYMNKKE
jgi:superfamily II DNA or RNA helicase